MCVRIWIHAKSSIIQRTSIPDEDAPVPCPPSRIKQLPSVFMCNAFLDFGLRSIVGKLPQRRSCTATRDPFSMGHTASPDQTLQKDLPAVRMQCTSLS